VSDLISGLKNILKHPLPGTEAHFRMAPRHRAMVNVEMLDPAAVKEGAVMILLFTENGQVFIPLIKRSTYEGVHSGQISLPGGKKDLADESLEETALRECYEEIGVSEKIEVLGKLTSLYIPVSEFLVVPYVGVCRMESPVFVPHAREVSKVIRLPLAHLLDDKTVEEGTIMLRPDLKIESPFFRVEGQQVWGATAMILSELKLLIQSIPK
jgi:8-oxo-dGTP pyrophosphatase MutT (NUDIX family)